MCSGMHMRTGMRAGRHHAKCFLPPVKCCCLNRRLTSVAKLLSTKPSRFWWKYGPSASYPCNMGAIPLSDTSPSSSSSYHHHYHHNLESLSSRFGLGFVFIVFFRKTVNLKIEQSFVPPGGNKKGGFLILAYGRMLLHM